MSDAFSAMSYSVLRGQQLLDKQRDRAEYLGKKSGQEPTSWYEFQQANVEPKRSLALRTTVGTLVGAAIGIGAKLIFSKYMQGLGVAGKVGVIGGSAAVGGLIGAASSEEEVVSEKLINKYKLYLDDFERSVALQQSKSQMVDEKSEVKKPNQVERVQTSRQQVADHTPSI